MSCVPRHRRALSSATAFVAGTFLATVVKAAPPVLPDDGDAKADSGSGEDIVNEVVEEWSSGTTEEDISEDDLALDWNKPDETKDASLKEGDGVVAEEEEDSIFDDNPEDKEDISADQDYMETTQSDENDLLNDSEQPQDVSFVEEQDTTDMPIDNPVEEFDLNKDDSQILVDEENELTQEQPWDKDQINDDSPDENEEAAADQEASTQEEGNEVGFEEEEVVAADVESGPADDDLVNDATEDDGSAELRADFDKLIGKLAQQPDEKLQQDGLSNTNDDLQTATETTKDTSFLGELTEEEEETSKEPVITTLDETKDETSELAELDQHEQDDQKVHDAVDAINESLEKALDTMQDSRPYQEEVEPLHFANAHSPIGFNPEENARRIDSSRPDESTGSMLNMLLLFGVIALFLFRLPKIRVSLIHKIITKCY